MVNDIVLGIAEKLRTVYPESGYSLYTENVEQGFKEPCFFCVLDQSKAKAKVRE